MNRILYSMVVLLYTVSVSSLLNADDIDYLPPPTYYAGATGTGSTLKSQLTVAMSSGHIQRSYGNFRDSAIIHDADPSNPGNILLGYNRASVSGTWDSGSTWNREHVWPVSRQPGSASNSSKGNLGDPHALRPLNPSINSSRGNKPFGFDSTTGNFGSQGSYYFPGDADKGDTARQLFYSDTRWSSLGLSLVDTFPSGNQMGDLSSLVAWHFLDTPDEFERRRNQAIYSSGLNPSFFTNNRNAFIDHPEFVWSVYVDQNNDSQLYVGGSPAADGGSTVDVDLGSIIVGGSVPPDQNVPLQRNGNDGTYYEVTTSGGAVSSINGRYNSFPNNNTGTDSTTLTVGLNASTASAGQQSGSVVIDNLDVTNGAGAGMADQDANDTVNVSFDVLDHSEASFSDLVDNNTLTLDFGSVALGSSPTISFDIFNLESTSNFTAALELDSVVGSGDTGVLTTDLLPFSGGSVLPAGSGFSFTAMMDASNSGAFSASYTLGVSDENLSGATNGDPLTLNLVGEVSAFLSADFNQDTQVDNLDLAIWSQDYGLLSGGDADGDSLTSGQDFLIWQEQYGQTLIVAAVASVPEPSTCCLAIALVVCPWLRRGRLSS